MLITVGTQIVEFRLVKSENTKIRTNIYNKNNWIVEWDFQFAKFITIVIGTQEHQCIYNIHNILM